MEVLINSKSDVEHEIEITLAAEELRPHFDKAYREEGKTITVPGFRKGRAPAHLIKAKYGKAIEAQILEKLSTDLFRRSLEERDIKPIGQPVLENLDYVPDDRLSFTVRYETAPEFIVGDYEGIALERLTHEVTEDEIDRECETLRRRKRTLVETDRAEDELTLVTCIVRMLGDDGAPREGGSDKPLQIDTGDPDLNRDLKAELLNMRAGEEKDVELTYEKSDGTEETEHAHIAITKIERIVLPDLDDAFASGLTNGRLTTVAALRDDVRTQLDELWRKRSEDRLYNQLVGEILSRNPLTVPRTVIDGILDQFVQELRDRQPNRELPADFDEAGFRKSRENEATATGHWIFIRTAIVEKEGIAVTDADIEARAEEGARALGIGKEHLVEYYRKSDEMRDKILRDKLMTALVARSVVTEIDDRDVSRTPLAPFAEPHNHAGHDHDGHDHSGHDHAGHDGAEHDTDPGDANEAGAQDEYARTHDTTTNSE